MTDIDIIKQCLSDKELRFAQGEYHDKDGRYRLGEHAYYISDSGSYRKSFIEYAMRNDKPVLPENDVIEHLQKTMSNALNAAKQCKNEVKRKKILTEAKACEAILSHDDVFPAGSFVLTEKNREETKRIDLASAVEDYLCTNSAPFGSLGRKTAENFVDYLCKNKAKIPVDKFDEVIGEKFNEFLECGASFVEAAAARNLQARQTVHNRGGNNEIIEFSSVKQIIIPSPLKKLSDDDLCDSKKLREALGGESSYSICDPSTKKPRIIKIDIDNKTEREQGAKIIAAERKTLANMQQSRSY